MNTIHTRRMAAMADRSTQWIKEMPGLWTWIWRGSEKTRQLPNQLPPVSKSCSQGQRHRAKIKAHLEALRQRHLDTLGINALGAATYPLLEPMPQERPQLSRKCLASHLKCQLLAPLKCLTKPKLHLLQQRTQRFLIQLPTDLRQFSTRTADFRPTSQVHLQS